MEPQAIDVLTTISNALGQGWQATLAVVLWATVALLRGDLRLNIPFVTETLGKLSKRQTTLLIVTVAALAGVVGQVSLGHVPQGASEWRAILNAAISGLKVAVMAGGVNSIWSNFVSRKAP